MARIPLADVADALLEHSDPVVTAPELADELGCSRRHMSDRLDLLEMEGPVESKKVGGRARVWWHEERVTPPRVPPEDHPAQSDLRDHDDAPAPAERDVGREASAGPVAGAGGSLGTLEADINDIDLPGNGDLLEDRRDAVRATVDLLRDRGTAEKQDFLTEVRPDHPAGFDSERGWWNAIGIQGLGQLADRRDDLRKPNRGAAQWRWLGDDGS